MVSACKYLNDDESSRGKKEVRMGDSPCSEQGGEPLKIILGRTKRESGEKIGRECCSNGKNPFFFARVMGYYTLTCSLEVPHVEFLSVGSRQVIRRYKLR